ncbi:MAG: RDD family protein [Chitinophagaceae bacterium]|nr:RDD family protein [Chitinophagaceae bacterium]
MPAVKLDTGFNIELEFQVAPFHKRMFAWMIDLLISYVYLRLLALALGGDIITGVFEEKNILYMLFSLVPVFYHLFMEQFFNGRSIGKMVFQLQVITIDGGQPSFGQYLLRWAFRTLDFPVTIIGLIVANEMPWWTFPLIAGGLFAVIVTPKSQRIGDLIAGTMVIETKNNTSWEDTVFTEVEATYQPMYKEVMQLSDRDINTLKSIINNVKRNDDFNLSLRIADRIKSKLNIQSDQDSLQFLETLLKDYNYYSTR